MSTTRADFVTSILLFGQAKGLALESLVAEAGLTMDQLADPAARIPDRAMAAAWRAIGRVCPDQAPALELAATVPLTSFAPFAHASRHAASRRDGLQCLIRYRRVLSGEFGLHLRDVAGESQLIFEHPADAFDDGHGAEAALALAARIGRELVDEGDGLRRVELRTPPRVAPGEYEAYFRVEVRFECDDNMLVFDPEVLDQPSKDPNPVLHGFIQAHLDREHAKAIASMPDDALAPLRRVIAARAARSEYGTEGLPRELGMSLRSIQRLTRTQGTSIRELLDEARKAHARRLLADRSLGVEQVAFLLGYADDRAFRRAFTRWFGRSPAVYRRESSVPA